ncbi:MAG: NAD-dependent epimerase/dehydratase family protein [Anaerolineae bacterium]|nr:NAD-dependent epimerase/dehydratase family protein [Anaerolineae bacterium]
MMTSPITQSAQQVVAQDLEYICANLHDEFSRMAGKKLLIVGGAGFLGYYLVQSILFWNKTGGDDHVIDLTVYDNYIRGVPDWLTALADDANLTLVRHDITEPLPTDIDDFHYIIHAASIASPTYYRKYPIETMDANVNGLRILLEYCLARQDSRVPVEGFLFYSTSEIYGDPTPEDIPTPETYRGNVSCTGPRACYDESKRYGETLCVNFARQYKLPIKIARPFNNYGPGLKITDRRVLPDFARNVLAGEDIVMLSDGRPTRTFCYIADAVVGYYKILIKGQPGEAYNIGVESPEISMAQLADYVTDFARDLFGYQGQVVRQMSQDKDYLADNPNRRCPVIDKARTQLGYNPGISLEEGLKRSLLWYADNADAEEA